MKEGTAMLTNEQKFSIDAAYAELDALIHSDADIENEHIKADDIAVKLLRQLGAGKFADLYEKRMKDYYYS